MSAFLKFSKTRRQKVIRPLLYFWLIKKQSYLAALQGKDGQPPTSPIQVSSLWYSFPIFPFANSNELLPNSQDVSRLLGEIWRGLSPRDRAPFVEQEERERALYKENIRKWRDDQARLDAASRTSHQTVQSYHHHQSPQAQLQQPVQRPYRSGFFDNLRDDSFDEQSKPTNN